MQRNWELIREILIRLESSGNPNSYINANSFENRDEQDVAYNMRLLSDSGYIEANIRNLSDGSGRIGVALATRLTNTGHNLLDTIRNDTVWGKVKDKFSTSGIDMTFDLVITVGKKIMEAMLS